MCVFVCLSVYLDLDLLFLNRHMRIILKYEEKFRLDVTLLYLENGDARGISERCNVPLSTVYRWGNIYRKDNKKGLMKKTTRPKKSPNKTSDEIENFIIKVWFSIQTKRNYSNVKKSLDQNGIKLSVPTIKKILDRKLRSIELLSS